MLSNSITVVASTINMSVDPCNLLKTLERLVLFSHISTSHINDFFSYHSWLKLTIFQHRSMNSVMNEVNEENEMDYQQQWHHGSMLKRRQLWLLMHAKFIYVRCWNWWIENYIFGILSKFQGFTPMGISGATTDIGMNDKVKFICSVPTKVMFVKVWLK